MKGDLTHGKSVLVHQILISRNCLIRVLLLGEFDEAIVRMSQKDLRKARRTFDTFVSCVYKALDRSDLAIPSSGIATGVETDASGQPLGPVHAQL